MPWNITTEQGQGFFSLDEPYAMGTATPRRMLSLQSEEVKTLVSLTEEARGDVLDLLTLCSKETRGRSHDAYQGQMVVPLSKLIFEVPDQTFQRNMETHGTLSKMEPLIQFLQYAIYLASNHLLSTDLRENIVKWISRTGSHRALNLILSYKTPTTKIFGESLLVGATKIGCINTVQCLIRNGVDVNAVADLSWYKATALEMAIRHKHMDIMRLLLASGATAKYQAGSHYSFLHEAIDQRHSNDTIRMLIDKEADVHYMRFGGSVLACAARNGDRELIRILLRAGAHVNQDFRGKMNALQVAIESENLEVVTALIDSGADINAPPEDEIDEAYENGQVWKSLDCLKSPIQLASEVNSAQLVQILVLEGAYVDACPLAKVSCPSIEYEDKDEDDYPDDFHFTALQMATKNSNAEIVRMLLQAGADVDERGHSGDTPLQIGAAEGEAKILSVLLEHGANINAPASEYKYGRTALQAAASTGNREIVQQMLKAGAEVNAIASPRYGCTTLQAAVESGNGELVMMLISIGADVNAPASELGGRTCLQAAAETARADLVHMLLRQGAAVNSPAAAEGYGVTPLQAVLRTYRNGDWRAHRETVATILEAGADVNAPPSPKGGISALEAATMSDDTDLVCQLLGMGADPNKYVGERTALGAAVEKNSAEIVSLLIKAGADVGAWYPTYTQLDSQLKWTALHSAARKGSLLIVSTLLNAGADIDQMCLNCPETPLQYAVHGDSAAIVNLLLAKGANPNKLFPGYTYSPTALDKAFYQQKLNLEIISALINAGGILNHSASFNPMYSLPVGRVSMEAIHLLLKAKNSGGVRPWELFWLLSGAVESHNFEVVETLLASRANVNGPGNFLCETPLQIAARNGDVAILQLLLSHGADVNARAQRRRGATALQAAAIHGHLKIVLILLRAGADINAPPAEIDGRTALEGAAAHGRLDIVHVLLKNDEDVEGLHAHCERAADYAAKNRRRVIEKILREYTGSREHTA